VLEERLLKIDYRRTGWLESRLANLCNQDRWIRVHFLCKGVRGQQLFFRGDLKSRKPFEPKCLSKCRVPPTIRAKTAFLVNSLQKDAMVSLREARAAISRGDVRSARSTLAEAEKNLQSAQEVTGEAASEATMYRVLASMGLEQAAFIHEVNAISVLAQGVAHALETAAKAATDQKLARRLSAIAAEARSMRERLRRNAIYLTDMTGIEGRKRRSRQDVQERFSRVLEFYSSSLQKRDLKVDLDIAKNLRTPPMFPAEVSAIFTNILSNAIKFAGRAGKISAFSKHEDGELIFRLENTGEAVDLRSGKRWFEPFRSSTTDIDESLGQGMGLGLTVTRSLLDEYGATIEFVQPAHDFATAVELRIPSK
jgi:signal transduction histidine kinase